MHEERDVHETKRLTIKYLTVQVQNLFNSCWQLAAPKESNEAYIQLARKYFHPLEQQKLATIWRGFKLLRCWYHRAGGKFFIRSEFVRIGHIVVCEEPTGSNEDGDGADKQDMEHLTSILGTTIRRLVDWLLNQAGSLLQISQLTASCIG